MNKVSRKESIINAAIAVLGEKGAPHLTMLEIADKAGITDAAIYRHFKNKTDLLTSIVKKISSSLTTITSADSGETPEKRLKNILNKQLELIERNPGIPRILFSDYLHIHDASLKKMMLDTVQSYMNKIEAIFQEAVVKEIFRQDLNSKAASYVFLGLIQSNAIIWSLSDFSFSLSDKSEDLWEAALKGLK
ncbi:MAG: TetR/AcrR family transcriptional regulator [Spirochaetia bacterium]|nr:TetR/AcrR family transcriptional regulator [Spirochaetia bacterium]